jgi:gliding motility-associated-like protein
MRYSVVDMTLDNGLGDIDTSQKNILVTSPICEKLLAIRKCDRTGYWVLTHRIQSNDILAYSIDYSGLDTNAIISNGQHTLSNSLSATAGYMKANTEGTRVAMAHRSDGIIELMKFDIQTGALYDPIIISLDSIDGLQGSYQPYGLEFSPDGKTLYASIFGSGSYLVMYDISFHDSIFIRSSVETLSSVSTTSAIQLAPDGNLYSNSISYLNNIENPDREFAPPVFTSNAIDLANRQANAGLPNFVNADIVDPIPNLSICIKDTLSLSVSAACALDISWDFDDPASGANNVSSDSSVSHLFTDTGVFQVTVLIEYDSVTEYFAGRILVYSDIDTSKFIDTLYLCKDSAITVWSVSGGEHYTWSDGTTADSLNISIEGSYAVTITNPCSVYVDSFIVLEVEPLIIQLTGDSIKCEKGIAEISGQPNAAAASLTWSNGDTFGFEKSINHIAGTDTIIWLSATNACGEASDTVRIVSVPQPDLSWFSDSILCEQNDLVISEPAIAGQRHFLTTSESPIILDSISRPWVIDTAGIYFLHAYNVCDTISKEAFLSPYQQIKVDLGADTIICEGDSVFLDATWPNSSYAWSTGELDSSVSVSDEGNYVVTITNNPCQMVEQRQVFFANPPCDSVVCMFSVPNVFTPNADGMNDQLTISNNCKDLPYSVSIYNRWGQLVFRDESFTVDQRSTIKPSIIWDGFVNGALASAGVYFAVIDYNNGGQKSIRASVTLLR